MIVAGIDPGKAGALFLYDGSCGLHQRATVPMFNIKVNGKIKTQPDYVQWRATWLPILKQAEHVFIERVGAMPGQGVTSMFSFGYAAGIAFGLVLAANLTHTFITPQSWKKSVSLSGSEGDQSRARASQLLPDCASFWARKKDDGIAEAALIAYAGHSLLTTGVFFNGKSDNGRRNRSRAQGNAKRRKSK